MLKGAPTKSINRKDIGGRENASRGVAHRICAEDIGTASMNQVNAEPTLHHRDYITVERR